MPTHSRATFLLLSSFVSLPAFANQETDLRLQQQDSMQAKQQEQQILQEELEREFRQNQAGEDAQLPAFSNPTELAHQLYLSVQRKQWQVAQQLLDIYLTLPHTDSMLVHYAQGAIARQQGDLVNAEQEFQSLLDLQPDFMVGQLELARVLFENRKNSEALQRFNQVELALPQDNPRADGVRRTINSFQSALAARDSWQGNLTLGLSYNDNVNRTSEIDEIIDYIPIHQLDEHGQQQTVMTPLYKYAPKKREYYGVNLEASLNRRVSVSGHHGVKLNLVAYGTSYPNQSEFNEFTYKTFIGYGYQDAHLDWSLGPKFDYIEQGNHASHIAPGVKFSASYTLSPAHVMSMELSGEYQKFRPTQSKNSSGAYWFAAINSMHQLTDSGVGFIGIDLAKKHGNVDILNYDSIGGRVGFQWHWNHKVDALLITSFKRREHDGYFNFAGLVGEREDDEVNATLILGSDALKFWQVKPKFSVGYQRVYSSLASVFSYDQTTVGLKFETRF